MAKDLIYVYCLSQREPNFKDLNLNGSIYSILYKDLYAVISRVSADEFNEENLKKNLSNMDWLEQKVRAHMKVISQIMNFSTVIPFKFGTVFEKEDNLKKMLEGEVQFFKDKMAELDGKEEWAVKLYCNFETLNKKMNEISDEIKQLDQEIFSSSKGKAFLLKKKRNELIKKEADKKICEYGQHCFDNLKGCAEGAVLNKLLPREVTEKENEMILNSVYLVIKKKVEDFLGLVEELKNKYSEIGFEFDCTGPWPPYNFTGEDK